MAVIQSIFQSNLFQSNVYQGQWGTRGVFQRGIFQENVFELKSEVIKIVSDSLSIAEANVRIIGLFKHISETEALNEQLASARTLCRILSESENIQDFDERTRIMFRLISDTLQISEAPITAIDFGERKTDSAMV